MTSPSGYYSLALRLVDRPVVIIGGDGEAALKVDAMLAVGARLTVVAADPTPAVRQAAQRATLRLVERDYRPGDLAGACVAFVCDRRFAAAARAEAEREHVLLNVLDVPADCDFIATAQFARDGLQFSVHSSGKSAALSRRVRQRLERHYGEAFAELTRALGELRPRVRQSIASPAQRRAFWLAVVDDALLDRVAAGRFSSQEFMDETLRRAAAWSARPEPLETRS